jgi:hypothetical protein
MRRLTLVALLITAIVAGTGLARAQTTPSRNFTVPLAGANEVPRRPTQARGVAIFHINDDGTAITYQLNVANIQNVIASHIHLAPAGVNGPIVVFLFGPAAPGGGRVDGPIAQGTITAANLIGPLAGHPLSDLITQLQSGGAYVNVHTSDGVDGIDTGPGDFPGGEIRGQVDRGHPGP